MLEFLANNKEWLFSGLGLFILASLWAIIRSYINKKKQTPVKAVTNDKIKPNAEPERSDIQIKQERDFSISLITAEQIMASIADLPILQQKEMARQYIGLKVKWQGTLTSISDDYDNKAARRIQLMASEANPFLIIGFSLDPKNYPGIGLLKRGHEMTVEGIIKKVDRFWIELENAVMKYSL